MQLPGGMAENGGIVRDFAFKRITGEVELALAEATRDGDPLPAARVTRVLCVALAHLGGETADATRVDGLCVGDRQFLVRALAGHIGIASSWLTATCHACDTRFDFLIDQQRLPVKPAGPGYPYAELDTSLGRCRFRVPCGGDQQAVAELTMGDAIQALVQRCLVASERALDTDSRFDEHDLLAIEASLETAAPEVTVEAAVRCPECGADTIIAISPYAPLDAIDGGIFEEIHELASHYHWSEAEILALPRGRRRRYLELIDRARRGIAAAAPAWSDA